MSQAFSKSMKQPRQICWDLAWTLPTDVGNIGMSQANCYCDQGPISSMLKPHKDIVIPILCICWCSVQFYTVMKLLCYNCDVACKSSGRSCICSDFTSNRFHVWTHVYFLTSSCICCPRAHFITVKLVSCNLYKTLQTAFQVGRRKCYGLASLLIWVAPCNMSGLNLDVED